MNESILKMAFRLWFSQNIQEGMAKLGVHPPEWKIAEMTDEAWGDFHAVLVVSYQNRMAEDAEAATQKWGGEGEEAAADAYEHELEVGIFSE